MHDENSGVAAIIEAARTSGAILTSSTGREAVLAPDGFKLLDLYTPPEKELPTRLIAVRTFHDGDSFARYVAHYKQDGSQLIADIERSRLRAIIDYPSKDELNMPSDEEPSKISGREHVAEWPVALSEQFQDWQAFQGKFHEQADFLRFLEENVADIIAPEPASILELVRDFSGVKTAKFQRAVRLDNGDRTIQYQEETGTRNGITIPKKIRLEMPIYFGEEAVQFEAWFRTRITDEGGLFLSLEFHRIQPVKLAAFRLAVARIAEASGLDAFYGAAV
jgi:uncharacterized protein YfdQ (DUF2303 family)